ncbi:hypothetical protein [Spiribacter roseus]|uniref:hypothetical protein n=1 Tax=Spiribacter roseus TaxID=1855875 RepID=UPI00133027FE|nr:hypothetical protein [Spiribacter roseus]
MVDKSSRGRTGLILATTSRGVYALDPKQSAAPKKILEVRPRGFWGRRHKLGFFGVASDARSNVYLAERVQPSWVTKKQRTSVSCLSCGDLSLKSVVDVPGCSDVHQIAFFKESLFLTDTAKDRVLVFDLAKRCQSVVLNLGSVREDESHINALHASSDRLLIGLNNRSLRDSVVVDLAYSSIFGGDEQMNIEDYGTIHRLCGITDTHDLEPIDGRILCSASKSGKVFDLDSGAIVFSGSGWVRGLTSDVNYIYIGESPRASRKKRHGNELSPMVTKIEKHSLAVVGKQKISAGGQLNDLIFLSDDF